MENNQKTIVPFKANGKVSAPPSKSMAHRLLICAALCEGESVVENVELSDDIIATTECLKNLGAKIEIKDGTAYISGIKEIESCTLDCNECGSTLRFMIPICLLANKKIMLTGTPKLLSRPLDVYEKICKENGFLFEKDGNELYVCGKLEAGEYIVNGNKSSQFISGLMFALPLLDGDSVITIIDPESYSYILLTAQALSAFGVDIELKANQIFIKGNQKYQPRNTYIEGDYSNAAFLDAFNFIGGDVQVERLDPDSLQGDKVYKQDFELLADGFAEIDLSNCPDLAPILFVVAALNHGAKFTGTRRLKYKESDRAGAMQAELAKFNVRTENEENTFTVFPSEIKAPTELVCGHNDHRIVMAFTVMMSVTGGTVTDVNAVNKSFPNFFEAIEKIK